MEQKQDKLAMLDLIIRPAFCVENGVIVRLNKAAEGLLLEAGTPVRSLLATGETEYAEFNGGCLYLTLALAGISQGASVVRMDGFDVFLLEDDGDQAELKAMALAAQNLREPLTGIMIMAERLFPALEKLDDPAVSEQAARINRGMFQMLRILGNMSDAGRYRNAAFFRKETLDITALMGDLFGKMALMCSHAGIELRFTNLRERIYCLADSEILERAVYNILSNALKFTPKGGHIDASLTRKGTRLYMTVQDSGCGIPESQRCKGYSRFLRQPGLEDSRQGIGLGMVLIRSAATAHGGTVLIEQPQDQGMRITLTLEIRQSRDTLVRSPGLRVDYAGEWDHSLIELSESLPASLYRAPEQN